MTPLNWIKSLHLLAFEGLCAGLNLLYLTWFNYIQPGLEWATWKVFLHCYFLISKFRKNIFSPLNFLFCRRFVRRKAYRTHVPKVKVWTKILGKVNRCIPNVHVSMVSGVSICVGLLLRIHLEITNLNDDIKSSVLNGVTCIILITAAEYYYML